ncbi:TPA: hypothetical protein EYP70_01240 [Candidatus Bathyarchaeota archaeon]|nr:hypothetical protein [Candidatus Bathyarchaeota archaeon]
MRIAIPTKGYKGLDDQVSEVFGRSPTFTFVEIVNGSITNVDVVSNPAIAYKHGAGPIVVKMLADRNVDVALSKEFGLGVSILLEQNNIKKIKIEGEHSVREAIQKVLTELKAEI